MNRPYYTLTTQGGNAFHRKGDCLPFAGRVTNIGETPDCDVRFEYSEGVSEYYASIIPTRKGWLIVKRSDLVSICIAGKGDIGYACRLTDGDVISFADMTMKIKFRSYNVGLGSFIRRHLLHTVVTGLVLLTLILSIHVFSSEDESFTKEEKHSLERSVYKLKVDSVEWLKRVGGKEILMSKMPVADAPIGTAFLTTDGRIVTARHCVEYWLARNLDLTAKISDMSEDDIVRWAIETESYNQAYAPDSTMCLRVCFSLYDFLGKRKHFFKSTDDTVHINRKKDGILQMADFDGNYYWRTIHPYFAERQMERGDILWIDVLQEKGTVELAKPTDTIDNNTPLLIGGFPITEKGSDHIIFAEGKALRNGSEQAEMIYFEASINHGYSGGPVLMKREGRIVAVGVVSRVDSISSGTIKIAVPTTEIGL